MASITVEEAVDRIGDAERGLRLRAAAATVSTVTVGQVLFASFVLGHGRGPIPMQPLEVVWGMVGFLILSLLVAPLVVRRVRKEGAIFTGSAREGRHTRRVAGHEGYFVIDHEVVLYDTVERYGRIADGLMVRYYDPRHEGPVVREMEMDRGLAERLARRFEAAGASTDSPLPTTAAIR